MASKIIRRDVLVGAAATAGALSLSSLAVHAEAPQTHEVSIKALKFKPKNIKVKVGDTIRWTNEDIAPHTATALEASWDTGEMLKGDSRTVTVTEGMETKYFCVFHPHMKGAIELV